MKINFSKFKKTKEDERSTELLHPDGHTIRIAHNGLKPAMRKELKAIPLAEGGDVPNAREDAGLPAPVQGISDFFNSIPSAPPVSDEALRGETPAPSVPQVQVAPEIAQPIVPRETASAPQPEVNPLISAEKASAEQMLKANQTGIAGEIAKAEALGKIGTEQAKHYETANKVLTEANTAYNDTVKKLSTEGNQIWQEMNSPNSNIDPEHFWTNHSKVGTAIGLILGGLGSGLTGGENPALKFLQAQMDRDLDAQKANLGKKKTLLDYNMQRFGNERDALAATRVMQNDMLANRLNQEAANNASGLAKANAQIATVHYKQENAKLIHQIAVNQALMGLNKSGPDSVDSTLQYLRVNNPEKAKEIEGRYVPGIGIGSVPVPEKAREEITAMKDLDHKLMKLESFAKKHQGTVLDRAIINEGKTLAADATSAARKAGGMGVYREGEQHFIEQLIDPDPTKFAANIRTTPKYKALRQSNQDTLRSNLKRFGLPDAAAQGEPEYKVVNGVKYMRGPKGEAIKVK